MPTIDRYAVSIAGIADGIALTESDAMLVATVLDAATGAWYLEHRQLPLLLSVIDILRGRLRDGSLPPGPDEPEANVNLTGGAS